MAAEPIDRPQYSEDAILTVEEVARYLRISRATAYKLVALKPGTPDRIPCIQIGTKRVVVFAHLRAWMAQKAGAPLPIRSTSFQH